MLFSKSIQANGIREGLDLLVFVNRRGIKLNFKWLNQRLKCIYLIHKIVQEQNLECGDSNEITILDICKLYDTAQQKWCNLNQVKTCIWKEIKKRSGVGVLACFLFSEFNRVEDLWNETSLSKDLVSLFHFCSDLTKFVWIKVKYKPKREICVK